MRVSMRPRCSGQTWGDGEGGSEWNDGDNGGDIVGDDDVDVLIRGTGQVMVNFK